MTGLLRPGWWVPVLLIKLPALRLAFAARMVTYRDTMFVSVRDGQGEPARRARRRPATVG